MSKIVPLHFLATGIPRPIVHCHGCFDVLHLGHAKYLQEAKRRGATLIVTVTSDQYVNKGANRPIFTVEQRAEMLAALECVDYVAINNAPDACNALKTIRPDFYIKGKDYKGVDCKEFETARALGAELIFTETEKFSTTELIERIKA